VRPQRVLLLGMPTMLRQILRRALAEPAEFEIVDGLALVDLRSSHVLATEPDVIIVDAEHASTETANALLYRRCAMRILGISADGQRSTLYEMHPHRVSLGDLTPASLVAVLRRGQGEGA
jgi:chemotaxis response regulator CheB